jgi:Recombination endonuclease VII
MPVKTKCCNTCKKRRKSRFFYAHPNTRDKLYNKCKDCQKAAVLAFRQARPGHYKAYMKAWGVKNKSRRRTYRLKHLYDITPEQYAAMLERQGGVCAGCGEPPTAKKRLHVDHCHKTRRIRGLLCNGCNRAIGFLNDSPERARKLAAYLDASLATPRPHSSYQSLPADSSLGRGRDSASRWPHRARMKLPSGRTVRKLL